MSTGSADEPVLDTAQVCVLADRIEAGVLAAAMLADPDVAWAGDASPTELTLLAEQGKRAQWRFVGANLGLVGLVTRSFAGSGTPNPDLFQEGCLGLITAVQRFDHRRGLRFSTYALYWVRAAVGAASARQVGAVQVPISRAEQLRTVHGLEAELAQELGRPATVVELADGLGRTSAWTSALLGQRPPQSLDALDQVGREAVERIESAEEAGAALDWVNELLEWLPGPRTAGDRIADGVPRRAAPLPRRRGPRLGTAAGTDPPNRTPRPGTAARALSAAGPGPVVNGGRLLAVSAAAAGRPAGS